MYDICVSTFICNRGEMNVKIQNVWYSRRRRIRSDGKQFRCICLLGIVYVIQLLRMVSKCCAIELCYGIPADLASLNISIWRMGFDCILLHLIAKTAGLPGSLRRNVLSFWACTDVIAFYVLLFYQRCPVPGARIIKRQFPTWSLISIDLMV